MCCASEPGVYGAVCCLGVWLYMWVCHCRVMWWWWLWCVVTK
jgi:hypothetical protein